MLAAATFGSFEYLYIIASLFCETTNSSPFAISSLESSKEAGGDLGSVYKRRMELCQGIDQRLT